jgi:hypothetical protein
MYGWEKYRRFFWRFKSLTLPLRINLYIVYPTLPSFACFWPKLNHKINSKSPEPPLMPLHVKAMSLHATAMPLHATALPLHATAMPLHATASWRIPREPPKECLFTQTLFARLISRLYSLHYSAAVAAL